MKINLDTSAPLVDLSMPIEPHWRFAPEISYTESETAGCAFHSTRFSMGAHAFTHVDAPWHIDDDADALDTGHLSRLWGVATVCDVAAIGPDRPITADHLAQNTPPLTPGSILLLRSRHAERFPTTDPDYWLRSPWLAADAARWVQQQGVTAIGFDFPQDRGIRAPYDDDWRPGAPDEDWACHRLLLTRGVLQIEYLTNLGAITGDRCVFFAAPLNFSRSDGSPVRAFAINDAQFQEA
ncbi:MAG TPA: cyclase family protein [Microlunatus sp.]